ncbi:putative PAP-specific phosphatase, mitochondrial [Mercurialis annua]|uniref:putative PAP-specific phosphatase, mitochondrial n=1 Tax=Mercurialis annua TaxID=3986 RepID=UPI00215EA22A|nr:putative PAP-specific phosphatase, mitochondrial [Mercurialis annua]
MDLLHSSASSSIAVRYFRLHHHRPPSLAPRRRTCFSPVRSSLPSPIREAKYRRELEAAVAVVERACRLCVDVQKSLLSSDGSIVEKNDQTPVTIADFGVQALVSLELGKLFPSIPLVAEEDSGFVRANNLVDSVVSVVTDHASSEDKPLEHDNVLAAIDRGGKNPIVYGTKPATYWVLDPIDGTRGFVRGNKALYVVGLALVVEGEIVLGIMGCPNWPDNVSYTTANEAGNFLSGSGTLVVAHVGCGTWRRELSNALGRSAQVLDGWTRCIVDECHLVPGAKFCLSDSQTWDSLPLSASFSATNDPDSVGNKEILILPTCCGSLCKYLMVASGRASVFILRLKAQRTTKAWDHAVGLLCVHEAGGKVSDWKGEPLDFTADQVERRIIFPSSGILVTNGKLHDRILETIASSSAIV